MASVTIKNLTKLQANALGIMFEEGTIQDFINENKSSIVDEFDQCPVVLFDESGDPDNEVEF